MDQDQGHSLWPANARVIQELHCLVVQLGRDTTVADRGGA